MSSSDFAHHPAHPGLVISIHDVSPITRPAVERIRLELADIGVGPCSLLVIPDHHRRGHFLDDYTFCKWLQDQVAAGDEAVVHGYYHLRNQKAGESLSDKLVTRGYTEGEGEFYDVHGAVALRLLSQGRQEIGRLGIQTSGFIAPAWLLGEDALRALRALNLEYTTRLTGICDLRNDWFYASQSLVWSSRSNWRRLCSRLWNPWLLWRLRHSPLVRVSIHPSDLQYPGIWRQIVRLILKAKERRPVMTYQEYVRTGWPS